MFPMGVAFRSWVPLRVYFTPAQTGVRSGELTLTPSDPNSPPIRVPLQGICGSPTLTLSSDNLVFGTTNVGSQSSAQQVILSNTGLTDLTVGLFMPAVTDFLLDATNFASPLAPGASASFSVKFMPSSVGPLIGSVTITSNDPSAPTKVVNLSGTGQIPDAGADATADVSNDAVADGPTADIAQSDACPEDAPGILDTRTEDAPEASLADSMIDQAGTMDSMGPDASSQDGSAEDGSTPVGPDGSPIDGAPRDARDAAADLSADSSAGSDSSTSDAPRTDSATSPNDAGSDASRGGAGGSGGRFDAATDGNNGTTPNESDDRGCGCRAAGGPSTRAPMWSMLVLLAAMLRKRVRRFRGRP
jgi:MYXO-CTERM domain-containing protein